MAIACLRRSVVSLLNAEVDIRVSPFCRWRLEPLDRAQTYLVLCTFPPLNFRREKWGGGSGGGEDYKIAGALVRKLLIFCWTWFLDYWDLL